MVIMQVIFIQLKYFSFRAGDNTFHAVIHFCIASDHSEDSILVEIWKKEHKVEDNMFVSLLRCVSVDTFETPCFVVEDKHGLSEEMEVI